MMSLVVVGRGIFLVFIIWVISFFLMWRLMNYKVLNDLNKSPLINWYGRYDFIDTHKTSASKNKKFTIPVHIVEEHHEVVKYWYSAVEKTYIPSKGNILFHIDAHSDGGIPVEWNLGPLFKKPKDASEIVTMMQGNDMFVVSAVLTGLITRYIWVWPPWNTENFEIHTKADYIIMRARIGTTYVVTKSGKTGLELCACATSVTYNIDNYCFTTNTSDFQDVDGIPIQESECSIRTSLLIEMMSSGKAKQLLESGTWITPDDNVILDVDEDYYGVEPGGQPLYEVGVTNDQIDEISKWSGNLLCAGSTQHERRIDHFFHSLIQTIIDFRMFYTHKNKKGQPDKTIIKILPPLFKKILHKDGLSKMLCHSWSKSLIVLKHLIGILTNMTDDQLNALAKVGLCLERSPKTFGFQYGLTMRLCSGYNTPNDSPVMFYTPSKQDVKERTLEIEQLLVQDYFVPGVVTICRSVRDGFTPRNLSSLIENDILRVLLNQYSQVHGDSIYYDKDLLSGPDGHYGRY